MKRTIFLATAALLAMLVLMPMALAQDTTYDGHHDGDHGRHGVGRHPGEWWPRHPSAGGRAASRVGYPDLRHSAAQVATN